jgi:hypothetical protein
VAYLQVTFQHFPSTTDKPRKISARIAGTSGTQVWSIITPPKNSVLINVDVTGTGIFERLS